MTEHTSTPKLNAVKSIVPVGFKGTSPSPQISLETMNCVVRKGLENTTVQAWYVCHWNLPRRKPRVWRLDLCCKSCNDEEVEESKLHDDGISSCWWMLRLVKDGISCCWWIMREERMMIRQLSTRGKSFLTPMFFLNGLFLAIVFFQTFIFKKGL